MAKGIIYVMTTVVPGLIKVGKTGTNNFESRMYTLEHNGYSNVVGLKRYFAIEVDDYDEKELLIDEIFSKSRLENTELFALDVNLVVQLLSSFEGKQIYPKESSKEEVFDEATSNREKYLVPDGIYTFSRKVKGIGAVKASMRVEKGVFTVLAGSECVPCDPKKKISIRDKAEIKNGILQKDVAANSPSLAAILVLGMSANGWVTWKDSKGRYIDHYRRKDE